MNLLSFYWGAATFVYGLAFGSFLNVCIHRLPLGLSVVRPSSACPNCRHPIRSYDNIPILSWFLLRGRCRDCSQPISARYWLVELLVASLFLASYAVFGGATWATFKACVFCFLIVGLIFTDAEHKLLPDKLTYPGIVLGLLFSTVVPVGGITRLILLLLGFRPFAISRFELGLVSLNNALVGMAIGWLFIFGVGEIYFRLRGVEGMGFGDVKLMAMVGAFLGAKLALFTIFTASFLGSFYGLILMMSVVLKRWHRQRQRRPKEASFKRAWNSAQLVYRFYEIPFGVFLGAMALLGLFFGNTLTSRYMRLFG